VALYNDVGYEGFGRPYCLTLKMDVSQFSETLVLYYIATQRHGQEDHKLILSRFENFESLSPHAFM